MSQTASTHQDAAVLDNPVWHALIGPHASFAIGDDLVRQYPADVAPFVAVRTFRPRTYELGRYIGIRRDGCLIAMAGERLHPEGWTEISAVATDVEYRGKGLASRLVLDVAFHIQERGDRALLHAAATNVGAIAVYERLGFVLRRHTTFSFVRTPA
jgi:predicted GNAT family acetyltransferase